MRTQKIYRNPTVNPGSQLQTPDLRNIRQINCDSFKTSLTQQGSNCLPARIRHLRILRSFGYSLVITPCLGHYAWRVQAQNPVLPGPQQRSLLNLRKVLYGYTLTDDLMHCDVLSSLNSDFAIDYPIGIDLTNFEPTTPLLLSSAVGTLPNTLTDALRPPNQQTNIGTRSKLQEQAAHDSLRRSPRYCLLGSLSQIN